jgi:UDP-glucuronate 4-epimerase
MKGLQPGDVPDTFADVDDLKKDFDFHPNTTIEAGLTKFFEWYKTYYKI